MSSMAISWIVFACLLGGALLGMFLRAVLPEHHINRDSKDLVMNLVIGLIAVMAALVLGLVISSTMDSFDVQRSEIIQTSSNIILLDRILAHYGAETKESRDLLRRLVARSLDRIWPENASRPAQLEPTAGSERLYDKIQELSPQNETQRLLKAQALEIGANLAQTRWLLVEQRERSIPIVFIVLLVFWLTIIFVSFGLFAPPNATVIAILFVSALSVSGAIFLILELDQPFEGLIRISSAPLRDALAHLGE